MQRNNCNDNQGSPLESMHNRCELKERVIEVVKQNPYSRSTPTGPNFVKLCRKKIMASRQLEETS